MIGICVALFGLFIILWLLLYWSERDAKRIAKLERAVKELNPDLDI